MRKFNRLLSAALILTLATACSVNPVTGKKELSIISPQQEVAIGEKNYAPSQQAQGGRYYIDPDLQSYVNEVGRKLAAVSDRSQLPYEFVVLNSSVPNAWALPGGKIAINRGLLIHLQDESELAAVLGHEIVHAAARHSAQQMTRGTLLGAGAQILGIAANKSGYGQLANTATQLGVAAWMSRYGRSAELESDAYGMEYMSRAGYDPMGAVRLQQTFVKLNEGRRQDFISGLFASHPPSRERVAANIEKAKTLPTGVTNRARFQQKIAQIKRDQPAYKAQDDAIKALKNKDGKLALSHLDKTIKIQPNDGYFWELRGHAWKMRENFGNAEKAFSTAIRKNPDLYSHHLARGLLRYEQGKKMDAKPDIERSHKLLPTQVSSYLLGELALAADNKQQAMGYYQAAVQPGGELGKKAQKKLVTLELSSAPHKYILSKAHIGDDGYLRITVKNNTHLTVTGIKLAVAEVVSLFSTGPAQTLNGPKQLEPGQQVTVKAKIGPFKDTENLPAYKTQVTSAQIAN